MKENTDMPHTCVTSELCQRRICTSSNEPESIVETQDWNAAIFILCFKWVVYVDCAKGLGEVYAIC